MFIERFFNPYVGCPTNPALYDKKEALEYCKKFYSFIRHYTFKSDQYIKYNGTYLIWNDGSKVDLRKLPKKGKWGKYFSELFNFQSF